jgi:hypothetical protein
LIERKRVGAGGVIKPIKEKKMTKEKQVTIKIDARTAAAVRQVLFDAQKGYTYDEVSVPPRVTDIREVIQQLDDNIGAVLGV